VSKQRGTKPDDVPISGWLPPRLCLQADLVPERLFGGKDFRYITKFLRPIRQKRSGKRHFLIWRNRSRCHPIIIIIIIIIIIKTLVYRPSVLSKFIVLISRDVCGFKNLG